MPLPSPHRPSTTGSRRRRRLRSGTNSVAVQRTGSTASSRRRSSHRAPSHAACSGDPQHRSQARALRFRSRLHQRAANALLTAEHERTPQSGQAPDPIEHDVERPHCDRCCGLHRQINKPRRRTRMGAKSREVRPAAYAALRRQQLSRQSVLEALLSANLGQARRCRRVRHEREERRITARRPRQPPLGNHLPFQPCEQNITRTFIRRNVSHHALPPGPFWRYYWKDRRQPSARLSDALFRTTDLASASAAWHASRSWAATLIATLSDPLQGDWRKTRQRRRNFVRPSASRLPASLPQGRHPRSAVLRLSAPTSTSHARVKKGATSISMRDLLDTNIISNVTKPAPSEG